MNHLPMHIDFDYKSDWVTVQNMATCNVEGSAYVLSLLSLSLLSLSLSLTLSLSLSLL